MHFRNESAPDLREEKGGKWDKKERKREEGNLRRGREGG